VADTIPKLDQIDAVLRHMMRDINRNIPVTRANRTKLLILASELTLTGQQIKNKVKANDNKVKPPLSANDNNSDGVRKST
jgi:hypothetical protein